MMSNEPFRASRDHWLEPDDFLTSQLLLLLEQRYAMAAKHVKGVVFEAGCGHGYGTHLLAQSPLVDTIHAWDIDSVAIAVAKSHLSVYRNVSLEEADITADALPVCDWMVCTEVMEHLRRPELFLSRAKEVVRAGVVLSWPLDKERGQGHPDHKTCFRGGDMLRMMQGWHGTITQMQEYNLEGDVTAVYDLGVFTIWHSS